MQFIQGHIDSFCGAEIWNYLFESKTHSLYIALPPKGNTAD